MIISDTSALVLNWTLKDIWKSKNAQEYFAGLDLSAADALLELFDQQERFMQTHSVSNRKFFVRKCAVKFLEKCRRANVSGQVIILAAGIAPLSVELASLYPESIVFDVDKYLMEDKKKYLNNLCPNITFIESDITNIELLDEKLIKNGWSKELPGILIMEGIIYYLTEKDFRNVLTFFARNNFKLVCDFGLNPECVNEKNRIYGVEVFRKIQDLIGLGFVKMYDADYFMKLVEQCGIENAETIKMGDIQLERSGERIPFDCEDAGWIGLVVNY